MLFNAPEFLFLFLPATLAVYFVLGAARRPRLVVAWLVLASLFFYGYWRVEFLALLLGSVAANFWLGRLLAARPRRWLLVLSIGLNLAALGWFKYAGFLTETINDAAGLGLPVPAIVLPLAISFYTFQQIAYLVDSYSGETSESDFARYTLFVTFFPQLIAGPIVHHRETMGQFAAPEVGRPNPFNLVHGITLFALGLIKKVLIADVLAGQTPMAFGPPNDGVTPPMFDAWCGAIAYTLQLYFDFSGYSDMAVGLGLMFNIRLPINFNSPYKAASIIEFWSRWHLTLTRFLTAYLYNPIVLALTRRRVAAGRKLFNRRRPETVPFVMLLALPTLATMTLAGIWHGAGWNFLVFGLLHGLMLVANHAWRVLRQRFGCDRELGLAGRASAVLITFLAVTVSLVFFKADSLTEAMTVLRGMLGDAGVFNMARTRIGPDPGAMSTLEMLRWQVLSPQMLMIVVALAIVWLLPNSNQYADRLMTAMRSPVAAQMRAFGPVFRPGFAQGSLLGALLGCALLRALSVAPSEFLYFTF